MPVQCLEKFKRYKDLLNVNYIKFFVTLCTGRPFFGGSPPRLVF